MVNKRSTKKRKNCYNRKKTRKRVCKKIKQNAGAEVLATGKMLYNTYANNYDK